MKLIVVVVVVLSLVVGLGYRKFNDLTRPLPRPTLDGNKYWGPGDSSKYKSDPTIKPFKVKRSTEEIEDLKNQLNRTFKFTEPLESISFEYGFNSDALEEIVKFWRDDYLPRWSKREKYLNGLPQFTTDIQGLRIHFIHAKPSPEAAKRKIIVPLLLLHGWPGSVREFYDFIPLLTKGRDSSKFAFEVIAPSLVGYGWSEAAAKTGFHVGNMAVVMRNLMLRLGHDKFLVQGGDWGSIIGNNLATLFPENVIAYHSNMCLLRTPLSMIKGFIAGFCPEKFVPSPEFIIHHFPQSEKMGILLKETGYFHLQATKPDTIGIALTQSPIGLAAYILEKFQLVTGPADNQRFNALEKFYTLDALLDNLMIYYLSNTATSAARLYAETMTTACRNLEMDRVQSPVQMGCVRFINDLPAAMDWQLKDKFPNLIHSTYFNKGGHFAALEVPEVLYSDFTEFVEKVFFKK